MCVVLVEWLDVVLGVLFEMLFVCLVFVYGVGGLFDVDVFVVVLCEGWWCDWVV